jgi:hypothetical protein
MRGWEAALEAKIDLHNFWASSEGERVTRAWVRSLGEHVAGEPREFDLTKSLNAYAHLNRMEQVKLHRAEPFYVTEDMLDVIEAAHDTFRPEPLTETDLIVPFGFVLLPRAHFGVDATGHSISFRAFGWSPVLEAQNPYALGTDQGKQRHGIWISFYSHLDDLRGEVEHDPDAPTDYDWRKVGDGWQGTPFMLLHAMPVYFGMTPETLLAEAVMKSNYTVENARASVGDWWRFVQVFFRLTMQYLSVRDRYQAPRSTRKRALRAKLPPEHDYVTVIRLRRPRAHSNGDGPRAVDWSTRWIVGSHWRNHWYPSLGMHRQILIASYIKGPEDRPLVIRKGRAFELVR